MSKHEILDPDRPGRKSNIKRLVYRPNPDRKSRDDDTRAPPPSSDDRPTGKPHWKDTRDWSSIKDHLRRTVKHVPEVVINVAGSRLKGDSDAKTIKGVLHYMLYISRDGRLPVFDQYGDRIEGKDAIRDTHGAWNLDMQRLRSAKDEPLHPTFNFIFSMPAKTDPDKLLNAVQAFAREYLEKHEYVMALHTPETEPGRKKDKSPEHPHVHLILRAEDENGQRIYIRKSDLRVWREGFAAELRMRGIEANASSRSERGQSLKKKRGAEWHIQKRYEEKLARGEYADPPRAMTARFNEAAQELQEGCTEPKPWEIAMAARRRDVMREFTGYAARLRKEGEIELADQVERHLREMPALDTEHRRIQRALVEQVQKRLQQRDQDKGDDRTE